MSSPNPPKKKKTDDIPVALPAGVDIPEAMPVEKSEVIPEAKPAARLPFGKITPMDYSQNASLENIGNRDYNKGISNIFDESMNRIAKQKLQLEATYARIYLTKMVFPLLEEVATLNKRELLPEVQIMIRSGSSASSILSGERLTRMTKVLQSPQVRFAVAIAKKYTDGVPDEDIRSGGTPFWIDRVKELRPDLWRVLVEEPNGFKWFGDLLIDAANIIRGVI